MNKCIFSGRLVRPAELRRTQSDKAVCSFSIAVTDGYGDKKATTFPTFTAWEKTAEFIAKLQKGTLVEIVARYEERPWVDRDGKKRIEKEFKVEDFRRLEWTEEPDDLPKVKIEPEAIPEKSYSDMYPDEELPF